MRQCCSRKCLERLMQILNQHIFSQLFFRYKGIEKSSAVASGVASGFMLNAENLENLENRPLLQKK